jgi:hypothetical protein
LYIYCSRGISTEAIILYFLRPIIKEKLSPHLPLIIGHSKCDNETKQPIDRFITERHGLDEVVEMKLNGHYEIPLWRKVPDYDPLNPTIKNNITNLQELCNYINLEKSPDNSITLPNKYKCMITDLFNYICISYIVTYDLLFKKGIYLRDMHFANIFIHWLNDNSYMYDQYIGDVEYIFYKCNNKYYKIKTFGFIIKIGDAGACIIRPREDLYIVGQANDLDKTYPIVKSAIGFQNHFDFLSGFSHSVPFDIFKKTIAFEILSSHPYDKLFWMNMDLKLIKDMKSSEELLEFYNKYSIDKIDNATRKQKNVLVFEKIE